MSSTRRKKADRGGRLTYRHKNYIFLKLNFFLPSAFPALWEAVENPPLSLQQLFAFLPHEPPPPESGGLTQICDPPRILSPSSSFVCLSVSQFWCICGVKFNSAACLTHRIHKGHPEKKCQVFLCPKNLILYFRDSIF